MPGTRLSLYSEPYSPSGNLAADGFRKLLGTPALDLLQTVVRESVQNSCDAAKLGSGPEIHFRLRRLDAAQHSAIREYVFSEVPRAARTTDALNAFLRSEKPWVLEISDFGTTGLMGPTRADIVADAEESDFVNFLRNVGSPRDTHQGGGTYGYGKTSLYLSSRCSTILVDTRTSYHKQLVRRLMACHFGSSFQAGKGGESKRFTGRHWWGVKKDEDGFVDPLEGLACDELADHIGFQSRNPSMTGTSIMILDPVFMEEEPTAVIRRIQEALLWWFWPRMLETTPLQRRATFVTEVDGEAMSMPRPEAFPPLHLFAEAINALRTDGDQVTTIRCERPRRDLGRLAIRKGVYSPRKWLADPTESLIPERSSCIAVMRPVELVVRYFEGEPFFDPSVEWAGVFVTSSEPAVESAFAAAEPPAHDDWQPSLMPKGNQRTFVNVAVQRLKEAAKSGAGSPAAPYLSESGGPSLARMAQTLGNILTNVDEDEAERAGKADRRKSRRQAFASRPRFARLEVRDDQAVAIFSTVLKPGTRLGRFTRLRADAGIVIDGVPAPAQAILDMPAPPVLDWCSTDGTVLGHGDVVELKAFAGIIEISVGIVGDFAIALRVSLEGQTAP